MDPLDLFSRTVKKLQLTVEEEFSGQDLRVLNHKPTADSWSILECLEHLNRYSRYYNPVLANAIARHTVGDSRQVIGYSWIGKISLGTVRPQNQKKSRTLKHMNPNNSQLGIATVQEFLKHQAELLTLLEKAKKTNLNRKAIPIEFLKLLKMRIGEALEFVIAHEERHVQQALRVKQLHAAKQAAASIR